MSDEQAPPPMPPRSNLVGALVAAMQELENIPRTNTADTGKYKYTYADLGETLTYVRPILAKHDLAVSQEVAGDGATITVYTVLWHVTGESYRSEGLTMKAGGTPQETGSTITYARRYSMLTTLGLATEDDDGALASQPQPREQTTARPAPPRPSSGGDTRPANRTREEAEIRQLIASLSDADARSMQADFKTKFGETLTKLAPAKHLDALTWVRWQMTGAEGADPLNRVYGPEGQDITEKFAETFGATEVYGDEPY